VIQSANIAHLVKSMKPTLTNTPGSSMDITFISAEALAEARTKIDNIKLTVRVEPLDGTNQASIRPAWLSVVKTREELGPNRLVRRAAQFHSDMEAEHYPGIEKQVTPDVKGKFVSLLGIGRVGGSIAGIWRWHPALVKCARYPPDVLQLGIDCVNDE
jgi:hypothetical protein